jgi:effector-binding domain-containing protein
MFEIQVREVPEQVAVSEQRSVNQAELVEWLPGAMSRVAKAAEDHGGVAGSSQPWLLRGDRPAEPVFIVVYEGNPNEGPVGVEVCAPIGNGRHEPAERAMRHLPAHREAYVRLTKAETMPTSKIGAAYAAVEEWVRSQGLEVAAAPREVYYTDYHSAAPSDDVFDVAFPIR